ncbi:MAG: uracil-DNA glycosylase family protein [Caulobacteraceae bacterium]
MRFASPDIPTGTAANLRRIMALSGLQAKDVLVWNTVPWVLSRAGDGRSVPTPKEIAASLPALQGLLDLLPNLRVALLAGRVASRAEPTIRATRPEVTIIKMAHPSPTFVNTRSDIFPGLVEAFVRAVSVLSL